MRFSVLFISRQLFYRLLEEECLQLKLGLSNALHIDKCLFHTCGLLYSDMYTHWRPYDFLVEWQFLMWLFLDWLLFHDAMILSASEKFSLKFTSFNIIIAMSFFSYKQSWDTKDILTLSTRVRRKTGALERVSYILEHRLGVPFLKKLIKILLISI